MFAPNATSPGVAPRKSCGGLVGGREQRFGSLRGRKRSSDVRVRAPEVVGDSVDHRIGHLGAAGAVEERERLPERRETLANVGDRGHATRQA